MADTDNLLPAELSINAQDQLQFAPEFQTMLGQISEAVNHASNLATVQTSGDLSQLDENDLETTINDLSQAQSVARNVTKVRRALKKYLKGRENNIVDQFDTAVNNAHFKELASFDAQAKQLKKDLSAYRINQRWSQLKSTFDMNIDNYPIIKQLAPTLANFDLFKMRHPKLVTGAKSWKFGDKQLTTINQDLYNMSECLTDLQNDQTLQPGYKNSVLQSFIANPDPTEYYKIKDQMINQQKQDAILQAQRAKEEQERQAQMAREAQARKEAEEKARLATQAHLAAQQAQNEQQRQQYEQQSNQYSQQAMAASQELQQAVAQNNQRIAQENAIKQQQQTDIDRARAWLSNFVMANYTKYGYLHTNNAQKVRLLYDLMHALDNPSSRFNEFLKTAPTTDDRNKLIVFVMSQVADV